MGIEEAKAKLDRAKSQLEKVQTASWDPVDVEDAVNWAFYSYENAIVAAAEAVGIPWKTTHPSKVAAAKELFDQKHISTDVGDWVAELNELRKDVQYGEPSEALSQLDLEDLASDLEDYVSEVESLINKVSDAS